MKLIDADALYIDIVAKGQASKRYKVGETWELTGAEIREVINSQPVLNQERKWISCSERLPELGINVLTFIEPEKEYAINHLYDKREWFYDGVVAWMSLPEHYKEATE